MLVVRFLYTFLLNHFPIRSPMIIPIIMLAFITLFIGLYPEPVISIAERASEELLNPERYIEAVLGVNR